MKKFLLSIPVISFILFSSCNDNSVGFTPISNKIYPAKLNTEWEYNTIMIIEYYDSLRNISNIDTLFSENTVVKVLSTSDTLGSYSQLIKFESYDLSTPENKCYIWYSNSDSGFASIAYTNAGSSQVVSPKIKDKGYLTFDEFKSIINSPVQNFFSVPKKVYSDSIQFYEIPRRVLAYPLAVNKRWTELVVPWYRERYVSRMIKITFNSQSTNCYEIKVDWPNHNDIEFNDYVSVDEGLVRREILSDSVMFTTVNNPDSGKFGKVSSISNLIRINR
jgi:hypothetical protein